MNVQDLQTIKHYLPMVWIQSPARDAAKVVDQLSQLVQRIDEEIAGQEAAEEKQDAQPKAK